MQFIFHVSIYVIFAINTQIEIYVILHFGHGSVFPFKVQQVFILILN